ncbi:MAG: hypothetical protein ABIH36_03655 [bacterium]
MEIDRKEFKKILDGQQEKTELYIGALKEDFDHKLDAVLEYVKDVPVIKAKQDAMSDEMSEMKETQSAMIGEMSEMKETQSAMFDKVGEMAEDVVIIRESVEDHERRLQRYKTS